MSQLNITSSLKLETSVQPIIPAKRDMYTLFSGGNICEPAHLFSKIMTCSYPSYLEEIATPGQAILKGIALEPPYPSYGNLHEKRSSFLAVEFSEPLKKAWAQHATGLYALKNPEDSPPLSFAKIERRVDGVWSVTAGDNRNSFLVGQLDQSTLNSLMHQLGAVIPDYQRIPQFPGFIPVEDNQLYVGYIKAASNQVLAGKDNAADGIEWPSALGIPKDCLKVTINQNATLRLIPRTQNFGFPGNSENILLPMYSFKQIKDALREYPKLLNDIGWTPSSSFTHHILDQGQARSVFQGPEQPPKKLPKALEDFIQSVDENRLIEPDQKVFMVIDESKKHGLPQVDKQAAQDLLDCDPAFYVLYEPSLKELCERTELYAVHAYLISSAFKNSRTEAGLSLVSEQLRSMLNDKSIEKNIKMLSAIRGFLPAGTGAAEFDLIYKSVMANDPTYESKSDDIIPVYLQLQNSTLDQDERQSVIIDLISSLRDIETAHGPKAAAATFMAMLSQGEIHSSDEWTSSVNRLVHFEGTAPKERPTMKP